MIKVVTTVGASLFNNYHENSKDIEVPLKHLKNKPFKEYHNLTPRVRQIKEKVIPWAVKNIEASAEIKSLHKIQKKLDESLEVYRAIRSPNSFSGGVVLPFQSLHWNEAKIRGYSGRSLDGRTLEPSGSELGNLMRRETVRKGPEAEEQTRFCIPKRKPVYD